MDAKFNSKTCLSKKVFLYFEPFCADLTLKFAKSAYKTPKNYFRKIFVGSN